MNWILPPQVDNRFPGHRFVVWAFAVLTAFTLVRSLIHMFSSDGGAHSIAHIPLETFSTPAADAVVFIFALWGLSQLMMGILYVIVLSRYRSLIPLMLLFVAFEYAGRTLIGHMRVIETTATAPGHYANIVGIPLALILLYFSRPTARG